MRSNIRLFVQTNVGWEERNDIFIPILALHETKSLECEQRLEEISQ